MRDEFVQYCFDLARKDKKFKLITADLGYGIFDDFRESFPENFLNVGVAEQNMIGIATGLSLAGYSCVCYSLGNFPTLRCLEQIRNDAAYHEVSMWVVSSGGGFGYGQLGMSHHSTEDVGIMRVLPNVEVFSPANAREVVSILEQNHHNVSVKYLRLEKKGPDFFPLNEPEKDGYFKYRDGNDGLVLALGTVLEEAMEASDELAELGHNLTVVSASSIKLLGDLDSDRWTRLLAQFQKIFVIEEHNYFGGLSSLVSEQLVRARIGAQLTSFCMQDTYSSVVGDQKYLRSFYKINSRSIVDAYVGGLNAETF